MLFEEQSWRRPLELHVHPQPPITLSRISHMDCQVLAHLFPVILRERKGQQGALEIDFTEALDEKASSAFDRAGRADQTAEELNGLWFFGQLAPGASNFL